MKDGSPITEQQEPAESNVVSDAIEVEEMNWVVLIMDPDYNDSSPYSVIAETREEAVEKAVLEWRNWIAGNDPFDPVEDEPEIVKVYGASWIGYRAR